LANRASGTGIGKPTADSAASRTFKLSTSVAQPRFTALLLGLFAVVALFLTALGLYGVLAYNVAQRTREIGVRMALGAQPAAVVKLVLNRCLALTLLGVGPGVTSSLALTQLLKKFLFGVRATDVWSDCRAVVVGCVVRLLDPGAARDQGRPAVALRYE
jgi:ABC-type antimicrobial peptide transport system permease subunit